MYIIVLIKKTTRPFQSDNICFFFQDQIQQLRDMGITDEALARRALQATGGDLQAALDLIFGDGHF